LSEQRKIRSELRQGLHQFLMQMYTSYLQTNGEDEAKEIVLESIKEQYEYFAKEKLSSHTAKETLEEKVEILTEKFKSSKDFDTQMYYSEKIDSLNAAIEILDTNI
jgi:uncharacterized coiled-coil DUF342 family protein